MLRTLTFFSACLAICWLLLSTSVDPLTVERPLDTSGGPPSAPRITEARAASLENHAAQASAAAAQTHEVPSRASRDMDSRTSSESEVAPSDVGHLAAPIPYVAKRLGLPTSDARLAFLSGWLADRRSEEHRLTERVSQLGGIAQREAMLAFNAAGDSWRRMLVQQVGYDLASQVVETFCMYRFEPEEGSWHRVDATGARVPFLHEDDDIWQRGESSNPRWEGHW